MAKILASCEQPKNQEGFEKYYFEVHFPLVQKLPNLKNASVYRVLQSQNTDANLYLIAEFEFENVSLLNDALASTIGLEVQKDITNLLEFLHKPPVISIIQ